MISLIVGAVAMAVADRFLLKRSDVVDIELGDVEYLDGFIRVPIAYTSKFPFLRGATVSYWMQDARKPTTVIQGEARHLANAEKGQNSEWLYIPTACMGKESGNWILTATVTHGDSFVNPLYRIFPIKLQARRSYYLTFSQDVNNGRK
uniref:LydB n=1 Tax=feces metagenome TaxID=1861841 RepID=A0A7M2QNG5_9ZZZZ